MAAERNFFHRWRGMTTIGYELGVIWEMSVKTTSGKLNRTAPVENFTRAAFGTENTQG